MCMMQPGTSCKMHLKNTSHMKHWSIETLKPLNNNTDYYNKRFAFFLFINSALLPCVFFLKFTRVCHKEFDSEAQVMGRPSWNIKR